MKPLAADLYCGLGGWSDGLIAEGWDCVGFDIERHVCGEHRYPGHLVIQDVRTLRGSQFRNVDLILASPPCQAYSYMAMPWSLGKARAAEIEADTTGEKLAKLNELFNACFRIQREACEASGRHIPMIVENVCGAQRWVGLARWSYGSFYLWGDVPALMPMTLKGPFQSASVEGVKARDVDGYDRLHPSALGWKAPRTSSKSPARKIASAMIARIPPPLARHIARVFRPAQSDAA